MMKDDNYNLRPDRGAKLRREGSRPTGDQTMSFKPEYSEEMDYTESSSMVPIGGYYARTKAQDKNHNSGWDSDLDECCLENGLNLKQPM